MEVLRRGPAGRLWSGYCPTNTGWPPPGDITRNRLRVDVTGDCVACTGSDRIDSKHNKISMECLRGARVVSVRCQRFARLARDSGFAPHTGH
jgi:hypothetical protein